MRPKPRQENVFKRLASSLDNDVIAPADTTPKKPSILNARQSAVQDAASGKSQVVKHINHPTERIVPWPYHNRDYAALNEERCRDLINSFGRKEGQQFPAIVRRLQDNSDYDFELICGARRHWTAAYLNQPLLVEVRDLKDQDAFLLQDIENRDREDVSDLERGRDYRQALDLYFEGNKTMMSEGMRIDRTKLIRLMALAELPDVLVEAYSDSRELHVHHGTLYTKLLKEPKAKKTLLTEAARLKGLGFDGKKVFNTLRTAVARPQNKQTTLAPPKQFGGLTVKRPSKSRAVVEFDPRKIQSEKDHERLVERFSEILKSM